MYEVLMELMKPEIDEVLDKAVNKAVNEAANIKEKEMICQAYKYGNSLLEISKFTGKSQEEVERIIQEEAMAV